MSQHAITIVYFVSGVLAIAATVAAFGRWLHGQIVKSVREQIRPLDNAVNHRKPGEPRLVEMVDLIWEETQRQGQELDQLSLAFQRHLGYHEGADL